MSGEIGRRTFLKYLGAGAGTVALASTPGKMLNAVPGPSSVKDDQTDYPIITTDNDFFYTIAQTFTE